MLSCFSLLDRNNSLLVLFVFGSCDDLELFVRGSK